MIREYLLRYQYLLFIVLFSFFFFILPTTIHAAELVGAWNTTTSLPRTIASHTLNTYNGKLTLVGGATDTTYPLNIYSTINSNGTISSWTQAAVSSPSLYWHSSISVQNSVYLIGGATFPPTTSAKTVYKGSVSSLGSIDLWVPMATLPENLSQGAAVLVGNKIYYAGGFTVGGGVPFTINQDIYATTIQSDGSLSSWTQVGQLPIALYNFEMIASDNHLIAIGGTNNSSYSNKVYTTTLNSNGTIGSWQETTPFPEYFARSGVVKIDKKLLVIGGEAQGTPQADVYFTDINANGTVGSWTKSANSLPGSVCCAATVATDDYVYVTGGGGAGQSYLSTVYYAKINKDQNTILDVPYYSQNALPWGPTEYDSTKSLGLSSETMDRWGCAVTSAAMVLNFHGMKQFTNGTKLDPGSLNNWLKQNNGYSKGIGPNGWYSSIVFNSIAVLSRDLFNGHKAPYKLMHERLYPGTATTTTLNDDLINKKVPDILRVPGHFVVAKGINNTIYQINDPEWNYPTLASFNNSYEYIDRFTPSHTNFGYITMLINPEVELLVTDAQGRRTGKSNGIIYNEIPRASYAFESPISNPNAANTFQTLGTGYNLFLLPEPVDGNYNVKLSGLPQTPYTLNIIMHESDGDSTVQTLVGSIQSGNSELTLDYNPQSPSVIQKIVTFQSMIEDVNAAERLGLIKKSNSTPIIVLIKSAELGQKNKKSNTTKVELNAIKTLLNKERGKGILEEAYQTLLFDTNALLAIYR